MRTRFVQANVGGSSTAAIDDALHLLAPGLPGPGASELVPVNLYFLPLSFPYLSGGSAVG